MKKRRGGYRQIHEPQRYLKSLQDQTYGFLTKFYRPPDCVHGFVAGRSIATNALLHVGSEWVFNVDLEDFFGSINFGRVRGLLEKRYGADPRVATVLARICTYNNKLPQGAPTSPLISNMITQSLDLKLDRLARRFHCTYSRYADDLTFSKKQGAFPGAIGGWDESLLPQRSSVVGDRLRSLIRRHGFEINSSKTRLTKSYERQMVTGLVVNELVNVPHKFRHRIRAMLYAWGEHGHESAAKHHFEKHDTKDRAPHSRPEFKDVVKGHIDFLGMVRGLDHPWYRTFLAEYAKLDADFRTRPAELRRPNHIQSWKDAIWVIESGMSQGTAFMLQGVGIVTCAHVIIDRDTDEVWSDLVVFSTHTPENRLRIKVDNFDRQKDLAVLKIDGRSIFALQAHQSFRPRIGLAVHAAGFPRYDTGVSLWEDAGEIVRIRKHPAYPRWYVNFAIVAGASGSPVMVDGKVVGIASEGAKNFSIGAAKAGLGLNDEPDFGVIPITSLYEMVGRGDDH